jgi:fatty-acyl-CoA synthase
MAPGEWSLAAVHDVIAETVPDRTIIVCGGTRRQFAEVAARTRSIAAFLVSRGVGLQRERSELERWQCGQDPVALIMDNGAEYLESMLGAYRARAVPFNVNQHYRAAEMGALLADVGIRAVVYHRRYGPLVAEAVDAAAVVLIDVDDGSGTLALPGSTTFEEVAVTEVEGPLPKTSPDDLYIICTGGTTGLPKAVMWRQADIFVSAMAGTEGATAASIADAVRAGAGTWYPVSPLMHAAAQWTAFSGMHQGATVVLHDDSGRFDPRVVLEVAQREQVVLMSIVGDAYARPLVEELRKGEFDLSSLAVLGTGGAATADHHQEALIELLPNLMIRDGYGSSEGGSMAFGARTKHGRKPGFDPSSGATVVSGDRKRFLEPGDAELGWAARRGRVPLGYLGDRQRTEATFPVIDGERVAIPGDRARLQADSRIAMFGRDSLVVNTGGEKVFVEEVEAVVRRHPDVADALVVGRPSDRFGQEVVVVVAPRPGADVDPKSVREFVAASIARYKAPRSVALCPTIKRHANGKADYHWARLIAVNAVPATGGSE